MFYSTKEVAEILGVCSKTAYIWVKSGKIKSVRIGRNFKVSQDEIDRIIAHGM